MGSASVRVWNLSPGAVLGSVAAALVLCSCGPPSPPEPKEPIPAVSILVLDRFDEPVPGVRVEVLRDHVRSGWGDFQPWDDVADATTDADGQVQFSDLREGDWADAKSADRMYTGRVILHPAKTEYTLRATRSTGFGIHNGAGVKDCDTMVKSLLEIAAHRVESREREFSSLQHYVSEGVITKGQADAFIRMIPYNTGERDGCYVSSGLLRLVVPSYEEPLRWVEIEY